MANPLAILAGLANVGAQGGAGALGGAVEGTVLKSKLDSEAEENKLRALRGLMWQQQLEQGRQPTYQIHGQNMYRFMPFGGAPPDVMPLPQGPLDPLREAQRLKAEAEAKLAAARTGAVGQEKAHVDTETNVWAAIQKKVAAGTATPIEQGLWDRHQRQDRPPHYDQPAIRTDAQGNEVAVVPKRGPDGAIIGYAQTPLGRLGKPMETSGQAEHRKVSTEHLRALTAASGGKDAAGVRARAELTALRGDLTAQRTSLMRDRALFMDSILAPQTGLTPEQIKARREEIERDLAAIDASLRSIQGERKVPGSVTVPGPKPSGNDPLGLR